MEDDAVDKLLKNWDPDQAQQFFDLIWIQTDTDTFWKKSKDFSTMDERCYKYVT